MALHFTHSARTVVGVLHLVLPVHVVQAPQIDDLREQRRLNVVRVGQLQQWEFRAQDVAVLPFLALQSRFHVEDFLGGQHPHVVQELLDEVQRTHVAALLLERGQGSVLLRPVIVPDVRQQNVRHHFRIPLPVVAALLQQLSQEMVVAVAGHCEWI